MSFVLDELQQRTGKYALDVQDTELLFALNKHLESFDMSMSQPIDDHLPLIWVLGLPRSGTTLTMQLLCQCLDVGYINNLAARFWKAPLTGIFLSRMIYGCKRAGEYSSDYGKTNDALGPHEFSYFWQHWLKLENMPPYDPQVAAQQIQWDELQQAIYNIANAFQKPLVFKTMELIYHAKRFASWFPKSTFIYIERDPVDVACSLAKGRLAYYGDLSTWFSMYPVEYAELLDLPFNEQIAGQVSMLQDSFESELAGIASQRLVRLSYSDLCRAPQLFLDRVRSSVEAVSGVSLSQVCDPPQQFNETHPDVPPELRQAIVDGFSTRRAAA